MKKCVVALSCLAALLLGSCGPQKEQVQQGDIQSVRVKAYQAVNVEGEWVTGAIDNSNGELNSLYEFDEKGYLTALTYYENIEDYKRKKVYQREGKRVDCLTNLDKDGKTSTKEVYEYADGFMKAHYIYHKCGQLVEKTIYENDGQHVTACRNYSVFDQHKCPFVTDTTEVAPATIDSIFHAQSTDLENRTKPYSVYKYKFADGKMIESDYGYEKVKYEWNGDVVTKIISPKYETAVAYDEYQNIVETINGHISGVSGCQPQNYDHYFYEYTYDRKGNWVKRIDFEGDAKNAVRIVERTIEYRK